MAIYRLAVGAQKFDTQLLMQLQHFVIMWRRQNSKIVHMCDPKAANHTIEKKKKQISNINL